MKTCDRKSTALKARYEKEALSEARNYWFGTCVCSEFSAFILGISWHSDRGPRKTS